MLSTASRTSAGVYQGSTLIRTLWNGEQRAAGTYSVSDVWDGKDDAGNLVADGNYQIKVLSNNVTYEWEGVVGNTSSAKSGSTVHHSSEGMVYGMVITGSYAYYANGYHERSPTYFKFDISNPQARLLIDPETTAKAMHAATDGTNVYWAAEGVNLECYIFATRVSNDSYVTFPNGVSRPSFLGRTYSSVVGVTQMNTRTGLAGLAVQKNGNYLFLSDSDHNQLKVLHKTTGALVQTLPYTNPGKLAVDGSDNLWMITGTSCKRYTVNSNGTLSSPSLTLSALVAPLAVAVAPGGNVAVADGGTSQQVKIYNSSGSLVSTLGQAGGYANGPDVTTDKLYFANTKRPPGGQYNPDEMAPFTFITYAPDGSFWVGDTGNNRMMHYNAGNAFIETIMNLGYFYNAFADANNPTRVFANYLEFKVDYSKPLLPNNGSWTLAKNWAYGVRPSTDDLFARFSFVSTLSNNRTYAFMRRADGKYELIELTTTGVRYTGVTSANLLCALQKNGDIYYLENPNVGQQTTWKKQALTGFDGSGNPQYSAVTTVSIVPAITGKDPVSENIYNGLVTSSGAIISFSTDDYDTGVRGNGYHVGLVKNNQWVAKFAPATKRSYEGSFPDNGDFDIGNTTQYTATHASSIDHNIFWGYNGEFWKQAQTNKWNHFYDNGLFVGQFGITRPETAGDAPAMMAGNAKNFSVVQVGSDYYLYHCDESFHGGIHRWKVSNLGSIQEQSIDITKSGTPAVPPVDYIDLMTNIPATSNGSIASGTGRWTYNPSTYNNAYADRWEVKAGLTTYKPTDRSVRFASYPAGSRLTRTGQCDLAVTPGVANNLSRWTITGKIGYPESDERDYNYLDVLDNAGRVIVRISRPMLSYPTMAVRVNNASLVQGDFNVLTNSVTGRLQSFSIAASGSNITVTYAGYAPITTTIFEAGAVLSSPKTLRVQMYSSDNKSHATDLANLRLYNTASTSSGATSSGVYLSDLNWTSATNGYGVVEKDRSNGELGSSDGRTITLNGTTYTKGLGTHAPSEIIYDLGGRYTTFLSDIGLDDEMSDNGCGSAIFRVYVDNALVYDSGVMTPASATKSISLDVTGKRTLKLVLDPNGEGSLCGDHGDWAGARVIPTASGRVASDETDFTTALQVYPVPARDMLWVHYYAKEAGELSLQLVNLTAQPVVRLTQEVSQGENIVKIPVREFTRGLYLLNLTQGYERLTRRVLLSE